MSNNKKINLKELDINNIGGWPRQAQMGFCVIVAVIIILLGWWLFVRGKQTELEKLEGQETELRSEFENKQGRASNLEPLKQQLAQILSGFRLGQLIQPGIENRLVRLGRLSRPAVHARTRQQILVNVKKLGQCPLGACPFL